MAENTRSLEVTTGAPRVLTLDLGPFRVSCADFPGGQTLASHYHPRACLSVIVEGGFEQRFPGRSFVCEPGSVLVKPPGETHQDRWNDAPARHLIVEPHPEQLERLGEFAEAVEEVRFGRDPGARALALRILHEMDGELSARELAVEGLALELLARVVRRHPDNPAGEAPGWLLRARELVRDRYREGLTLDEVAGEVGVHPTHLSRTFSRYFGTGMAAYLRELRLDAARRELTGTDDSISRVALRNGFADQSHFTRALKRATGVTPGQYREITGTG